MSFEMVHAKNYFFNMFLVPYFHLEITSIITKFIILLRLYNYVDMMQSMNGIAC